ncbi:MAG TPA: hypothetical protein VEP68_06800 [Anaeromyxobacteraceae bacterium]|nr:hypothetical protein [Anaeromyxobacteraceae bacterium]
MVRMRRSPTRALFATLAWLTLASCSKELVCASDLAACQGRCVSLATDATHCGACGHACGPGQVCAASACAYGTVQDCGALGRTCATGERCVSGGCVADLYLACFDTDEVREATSALDPAGIPIATEAGPVAMAWLGDSLFVADSLNNTVDEVRFDPPAVGKVATITILTQGQYGPDLEFIAAGNGLLYVSNAAANVLDVLDPLAGKVVDEIPLGAGAFPAGIFLAGTKAYVALNGTDEVAIVDVSASATCQAPPCGVVSRRVALPAALADAGGRPLPARLAAAAGRLYVTLWNLKPDFTPAGNGRLAAIDLATDELVTATGFYPVDLGGGCQNPADVAAYGQVLYVTCGFFPYASPGTISGAGIVPVDVSSGTPVVGTGLSLSANAPGPIAFCGGVGYAGDRASGAVLRYDPGTHTVTATQTLCPPRAGATAAYVADVACGP